MLLVQWQVREEGEDLAGPTVRQTGLISDLQRLWNRKVVKPSTADLIWITFLGGERQHRVCDEEKLSRLQLVYRNQTEIIPVIKCV